MTKRITYRDHRIGICPVGINHALIGHVYDRTGRQLVGRTSLIPHGMRAVALSRSREIVYRIIERAL